MRFPLANPRRLQYVLYIGGAIALALAVGVGVANVQAGWPSPALASLLTLLAVSGLLTWLGREVGDSFVEVSENHLRVKMGRLFDQVIPLSGISDVREGRHPAWGGLGIRTDFRGTVAVVTAIGTVIELELMESLRLPVIPGLLKVRCRRLRLSVADRDGFLAHLSPRISGQSPDI